MKKTRPIYAPKPFFLEQNHNLCLALADHGGNLLQLLRSQRPPLGEQDWFAVVETPAPVVVCGAHKDSVKDSRRKKRAAYAWRLERWKTCETCGYSSLDANQPVEISTWSYRSGRQEKWPTIFVSSTRGAQAALDVWRLVVKPERTSV